MYSMHNDGKSIIGERIIRTPKNKIYKYMTPISKNVYIDKLDDIVNKYNHRYHSTVEMNPVDVKSNTYIDSSKKINDKDHKFNSGYLLKILKYKNIFAKAYVPNWSEEVFVIFVFLRFLCFCEFLSYICYCEWTYVISDLKGEEIVGTFYEKELLKANQIEFRVEKLISRKDGKLYVKWIVPLTVGLK